MDELYLLVEMSDGFGDRGVHQCEVPLTETDPVVVARIEVEDTVVLVDAGDDAGDAAYRRYRGIVGMKRELDVRFLGDRDHAFEEVPRFSQSSASVMLAAGCRPERPICSWSYPVCRESPRSGTDLEVRNTPSGFSVQTQQ